MVLKKKASKSFFFLACKFCAVSVSSSRISPRSLAHWAVDPWTSVPRRARGQTGAMSTFGTIFRVTTFGESHCKGVGAIVDGVPPRMCARRHRLD